MRENIVSILENDKIKLFICSIFVFCLSFFILNPNLEAELGPIDDHEFIFQLNVGKNVNIFEFLSIGYDDHSERYRPVYRFLRSVEVFLWRDNASLFYLTRIIICALCIILCFLTLSKSCNVNIWLALIFSCFIFFRWYFKDVWCRLGPSEAYAMLGMMLFCRETVRLLKDDEKKGKLGLVFLSCGFIIAVGSKENFIFLAGLIPLLIFYSYRQRKYINMTVCCLLLFFAVYVAMKILFAISDQGTNIYNQNVYDYQELATNFFAYKSGIALWITLWKAIAIISLIIGVILNVSLRAEKFSYIRSLARYISWLSLATLIVYTSQYIIYSGKYPSSFGRYNVPGMFVVEFFCLGICVLSFRIIRDFYSQKILPYIIFFVIVVLSYGTYRNALVVYKQGHDNAVITQDFHKKINEIIKHIKGHARFLIIFENYNSRIMDAEPFVAIRQYLNYYLHNDREITYAIRVHDYDDRLLPYEKERDSKTYFTRHFQKEADKSQNVLKEYGNQCVSISMQFSYFKDRRKPSTINSCLYKTVIFL